MQFCLNSIRKIIIRVTSSKRYQNVRSDQTILGPFANVTLTLCVSWVVLFSLSFLVDVGRTEDSYNTKSGPSSAI